MVECSLLGKDPHSAVGPSCIRYYSTLVLQAYFLKSNTSLPSENDGWTCGGAIITKLHILTSASCLYTYEFIYAIAGYRRYVNADLIDLDTCTSKKKKRVIKICVPKGKSLFIL